MNGFGCRSVNGHRTLNESNAVNEHHAIANNALVNEDFKEMEDSNNEQKSAGQGSWKECFARSSSGIPRVVYRTLLGCALQFAQQWTGVNYFFYVSLAFTKL